MKTIISFFQKGFNTNNGYSIIERLYPYDNKLHTGYVLVKNYTMLWIKGYDRIEVFCDKNELDKYLRNEKINRIIE
jgi:hypothetical protein